MDSNFSHDAIQPAPGTPHAQQREYARKAADADAQHHFWLMLWFEIARDYHASVAYVISLVHQLDDHHPGDSGPHSRH